MGNALSWFVHQVLWPSNESFMTKIENPNEIFPMKNLIAFLNFSTIAYSDETVIKKEIQNNLSISNFCKVEEVHFLDGKKNKEDTQGYLFKICEDRLCVVFRGTNSIQDMIANVHVDQINVVKEGKIKIHCGFYRQFMAVEEDLQKFIKEYQPKEILFIGHSSGAACATIGAWHFARQGYQTKCYTYGCPRLGNTKFLASFESIVPNSVRVFNKRDPVPMIPFSANYVHVGRGLCLDEGSYWLMEKDTPFHSRPILNLINFDYKEPFSDHKCATYLSCLERFSINEI